MDKNTGEVLLKLQETINSWAQEVTETRSALTQSLEEATASVKPAFQLIQPSPTVPPVQEQPAAPVVEAPPDAPEDASHDLIEANKALMRRVEELEIRVAEAERRAHETERERTQLDAEIDFAREQLHLRNNSAQEAEDRRAEYEMQAEQAVQALGTSELESTDLRQQLRSRDWRLLKTRNVLDLLREDHARRVAEVEALSARVEDLRIEVEERQASEGIALASLDTSQGRIRQLEADLEESRSKADTLSHEIEAIWEALNGSNVQLQEAREEIARLIAERDERNAALVGLEEQMRSIKEREEAFEGQLAQSDTRAAGLESALASQKEENASLMDQLAEARSATDARMAELKGARDAFAKLQTDYDDLISSNRVLRGEVIEVQARLAERDLAVAEARRELEEANQDRRQLLEQGSDAAGRMDELSAALEEKTASLEEGRQEFLESESAAARRVDELSAALGERTQAYEQSQKALEELRERAVEREQLERVLRDELASLREKEKMSGTGQESLNKALRDELESMRQVAVERDFVIHHAEAELASMSRREAETEDALKKALEATERIRAGAGQTSQAQRALEVEISELRLQGEEKDTAMRDLCDELKVLRERMGHLTEERLPGKAPAAADKADDTSAMLSATPKDDPAAPLDRALARLRKVRDEFAQGNDEGWGQRLRGLWRPSKSDSKKDKG
ncbi:MAG: hypothetical protein IID09_01485 [Candidatus Hydrogenedentes bacterium]|nr:hypothetical protein [Candidatus Hydrogenedentota bacterium]